MISPAKDDRSAARKQLDEQIASEPPLAPPNLPVGAVGLPLEAHLRSARRPFAVAGLKEVSFSLIKVLSFSTFKNPVNNFII